eukprot:m.70911 g.70911  ORF g.70911 m.70911 type:complete len:183 (+) comp14114_c0_seq1:416-964(+)
MRIWSGMHVFGHPWERVTAANWRKYPNPFNPGVVSADIVAREVDEATGRMATHRIIKTKFNMPRWLSSLIGEAAVYVSEVSETDPHARTLTMRSRNLSFDNILSIEERVTYSAHPEQEGCTLQTQEARIRVPGSVGVAYMEAQVASTVETNSARGREALEHVIHRLQEELQALGRGEPQPAR